MSRLTHVKKEIPPTLWYENADGVRYVPTQNDLRSLMEPPEGFIYQLSQFPTTLEDTILRLVRENGSISRSEHVMTGHSSWPEDLVLAMANSKMYSLSEAILVVARSCGRCMNAMAHEFGMKWGYPADSDDFLESNTHCMHCEEQSQ